MQDIGADLWRKAMTVNVEANLRVMQACHALLKLAPRGGRIVVIGSKNVPAPGPGAAAYSASKAAMNQLARVTALEWGKDGIRINTVHPNAVYDTALWTDEVLAARAKAYGSPWSSTGRTTCSGPRCVEGRGRARRRDVRSPVREDDGGAGAGGRRQRARGVVTIEPLRWKGDRLELLDQRLLPERTVYVTCRTAPRKSPRRSATWSVRGAPAIGCAAAFGIALDPVESSYDLLAGSRPTAVNLFLGRSRACAGRVRFRHLVSQLGRHGPSATGIGAMTTRAIGGKQRAARSAEALVPFCSVSMYRTTLSIRTFARSGDGSRTPKIVSTPACRRTHGPRPVARSWPPTPGTPREETRRHSSSTATSGPEPLS